MQQLKQNKTKHKGQQFSSAALMFPWMNCLMSAGRRTLSCIYTTATRRQVVPVGVPLPAGVFFLFPSSRFHAPRFVALVFRLWVGFFFVVVPFFCACVSLVFFCNQRCCSLPCEGSMLRTHQSSTPTNQPSTPGCENAVLV